MFIKSVFAVVVDGVVLARGRVAFDEAGRAVGVAVVGGSGQVRAMFVEAKKRTIEAARDAAAIVVEAVDA